MQRQLLALFLLGSIYGVVSIGPCSRNHFQCDDGVCIAETHVCDGDKDCDDGSDELPQKCAERVCPHSFFKCKNANRCLHSSFLCDGTPDCSDGSDEMDCDRPLTSAATACTKNEFQCRDRFHCIPLDEYCDGRPDCIDGSDEFENCHYNKTCTGFKCNNGHCIVEVWKCDGTNDCGDNSDELHCDTKPIEAANCTNVIGKYLCKNKRCINLDRTCNALNDCGDDSDEDFAKCETEKTICTNSTKPCTHKCFPTPRGYQCSCPEGFVLKPNGGCEDIDECMSSPCEQVCRNSIGSYYCQCADGYKMQDNGHCKAENGEGLMVFASKSSIRGYYLESGIYFAIADGLEHVVGVSLDPHYVYWSDIQLGDEAIFRSQIDDGENREVIANSGLGCPEEIAVDWVTGNIYFTDSMYMHVGVCSQHDAVQTYCTVIIKENTEKPRGIALLPSKKRLYWSDWGQNPHISVADMDGQNREFFIQENLGWPNGLTIDYASERLYWVDAKLKVIESILLNGGNRRTVLHDVAKHPYSIAIFENRLFWSDWSTNSIHSCDKTTGKNYTTLFQKNETVYGIHIYHSTLKVKHSTPCVTHPCSHLCLLAPKSEYTCACPLDMELSEDKHTCKELIKRKHMAIAAGNTIIDYYHELLGKPKTSKNGITSEHISALTYDSLSDSIIVADAIKSSIFRYNQHKDTVNHMIPLVDEFVESMAFDHFGNNLYKSNALHRKIEVHSLTTGEKTEFSYTESPYNLIVIPEEGIMFIVFRANNGENDEFHIDKAQMNGLGSRSHVIEHGLVGPVISLAYDVDARRIYWSDEGTGRIESMDTQGHNRVLIRTAVTSPVSLAVLYNNVFWTSRKSDRLSWTDKNQSFSGAKGLNLRLTNHPTVIHLQTITGIYSGEVHPCRKNNGDCSHICLVSDSRKKLCACPSDYSLNTDQKSCRPKTACFEDELKCNSTEKCIKKFQRCDGLKDCPNGEDENFCSTESTVCQHDEFACRNGQCIQKSGRCDSIFNCKDRSDEQNCENATCSTDLFRCHNGNCVSLYVLCNGADDCGDFSDEESCSGHACDDHSFQCGSGLCIPRNWECDGQVDCNDGSDEHSKCKPTECGQNMFSCSNGHCIDTLLRCNGIDDCNDNSDEHACSTSDKFEALICTKYQYKCRNSTICIHNKLRCDGNLDCPKHDDEFGCGKCLPDTQFTCRNGNCVPVEWTCDQADDCGDNSDELHCDELRHLVPFTEEPPHNCSEGQHACKTGYCLDLDKFCDGKSHCLDASDEGGQCETACVEKTCENICHKTPNGPVCSCRDGYKLSADGKSCEDIDECKMQVCPQLCTNRLGSYSCSCYDGYALRLNRMSCKATGPPVTIFTATDDDIRMIHQPLSLHSLITIVFQDPGDEITGLDVNARDNTIYWSSANRGEINKMHIETKQTSAVSSGLVRPEVLAVDWVTDNVYCFDNRQAPVIQVCDVNASRCSKIVHIEGSNIKVTAIAIEANEEILFWSQVNWKLFEKPRSEILRSDLRGADSKKIVHENLGIVSGLTIDHNRKILYWADNYETNIECVDFNGENRKSILEDLISKPIGLHFYEDSLYWKTETSGVLRKRQLYGDMTYTLIPIGSSNLKKLFVVSQISRQPEGINKCKDHGCEYMCIMHKKEPMCICGNGTPATLRDGRGCSEDANDKDTLLQENSTHIRLRDDEAAPTVGQAQKSTGNRGSSAITGLAVTLVTFALLFSVYFYLKKKKPGLFKGRVLSSIHFQNPSFARRRNNNSSMTSSTSILMPGEHEYSNPITEMPHAKSNLPDSSSKKRLEVMPEVSDGETDETNPTYNSRLIR